MPERIRPDRIRDTLEQLRVDADRAGLPDSGAVRRRGDRRSRNQALGWGAAAVAIVAGVAGIAGLAGARRSAEVPTETPTLSTTQEPLLTLATDPFLREGDLSSFGDYQDFLRSPQDALGQPGFQQCLSRPTTWGATETRAQLYDQDLEAGIVEHVLVFAGSRAAAGAVARVGEEFAGCPAGDPAEVAVTDREPEPIAGGVPLGFRASRAEVPKFASETGYYEIGVARRGNVVVVLEWGAYGNPAEGSGGWVWTAERLGLAVERAVG